MVGGVRHCRTRRAGSDRLAREWGRVGKRVELRLTQDNRLQARDADPVAARMFAPLHPDLKAAQPRVEGATVR